MDYGLLLKVIPMYSGIKRRNREDYITHVIRVADALKQRGASKEIQVLALVHDVLEIGNTHTIKEIVKMFNFSKTSTEALVLLTRNLGETSQTHFDRLIASTNVFALLVKYYDFNDNCFFTPEDYIFTVKELGLNGEEEQNKYKQRMSVVYDRLKFLGLDLLDY